MDARLNGNEWSQIWVSNPGRAISAVVALLAVTAMAGIGAGTAGAEVVYNNVPSPLPPNFVSIGLAATSTTEFGGEIELAGTARSKPTITVVMSSWACESGGWNTHDCSTPKPNPIKLGKLKKMPKRSIVTVAYPHSSGPATSLNISVSEPEEETLSIGGQPVEEWFANSTYSEMYCPGAKDIGTLGPEEGVGCQEGINYQPVFAVSAN